MGFAPEESYIYTSPPIRGVSMGQTRAESASVYSCTTQVPCIEPRMHSRASDDLSKYSPILSGGKRGLSLTFLQPRVENRCEHPLPTPSQWIKRSLRMHDKQVPMPQQLSLSLWPLSVWCFCPRFLRCLAAFQPVRFNNRSIFIKLHFYLKRQQTKAAFQYLTWKISLNVYDAAQI